MIRPIRPRNGQFSAVLTITGKLGALADTIHAMHSPCVLRIDPIRDTLRLEGTAEDVADAILALRSVARWAA